MYNERNAQRKMIVSNIRNCDKYYSVHKDFEKAFEWLKSLDKNSSMDKVFLDGDNVWGKIFEDVKRDDKDAYEAHREYIDIHYIIEGEEEFGYSDISYLDTKTPYSEEKEREMLTGDFNKLIMKKGDFCVVFPEDAHIPGMKIINGEKTIRAMAKVRV